MNTYLKLSDEILNVSVKNFILELKKQNRLGYTTGAKGRTISFAMAWDQLISSTPEELTRKPDI